MNDLSFLDRPAHKGYLGRVTIEIPCESCNGTGKIPDPRGDYTCFSCLGGKRFKRPEDENLGLYKPKRD